MPPNGSEHRYPVSVEEKLYKLRDIIRRARFGIQLNQKEIGYLHRSGVTFDDQKKVVVDMQSMANSLGTYPNKVRKLLTSDIHYAGPNQYVVTIDNNPGIPHIYHFHKPKIK